MIHSATLLTDSLISRTKLNEPVVFSEGINVVVGDNGTGKSTLLRAIYEQTQDNSSVKAVRLVRDEDPVIFHSSELVCQSADKKAVGNESSTLDSNNVSHGQSLLRYLKNLTNLDDPMTIILDEPEVALSINSLATICKIIQSKKNIQFIISSHHPLVWTLSDAKFITLGDEANYVKKYARMYTKRLEKLV